MGCGRRYTYSFYGHRLNTRPHHNVMLYVLRGCLDVSGIASDPIRCACLSYGTTVFFVACISVVIAFLITSSHIVLAGGLTLPVIGTIGVWGYVQV